MNYKSFFLFFFFLFIVSIKAQTTYFIKYKDYVSKNVIAEKVRTKQIVPAGSNFILASDPHTVNYLAHGMAKNIESLSRIITVTFDSPVDSNSFKQLSFVDPDIDFIQPARTYKMDLIPNDSLASEQWALAKIDAYDAWDITTGSDTVLLGIIDTGIDYRHPDLINKMWENPGETGTDSQGRDKRYNGIDDDNNGFIDDYRGWDFTNREGFPFDSTDGDFVNWDNNPLDTIPGQFGFHGTFVAGIAGAEFNNLTGIAGVAPNIKLMNIRAFDNTGNGGEDDVAAAILYAVQMGAKVINMSFGDNSFSYILKDVIQYAYAQGVVLVGSSGNSNSEDPHYPSGYSEVICVGSSTDQDYRSSTSNYGSTLDLVAPGSDILSTDLGGGYVHASGTSAATPYVAGTAALILSLHNYTNEEVKQILKSTSDDIGEQGWDIYTGAGRLNTYNAVKVNAPAVIRFEHPLQDFSTYQDSLQIYATLLTPYFVNYKLDYGYGLNPNSWTHLIENGQNQFTNKMIYNLDLSQLPDSVYTLRLLVNLNNGSTTEERVNFYIIRHAPNAILVNLGPSFYGNKTTILASVYTDQPCVTRLYYRKAGTTSPFSFLTLDGFNVNNQFVSYLHYGFIPKEVVDQNSSYEVYLQAENLVGLKTTIINPNNPRDSIFVIPTTFKTNISGETVLPYSLPNGSLYENPTNFLSSDSNEVLLGNSTSDYYTYLYKMHNGSLVKTDSILSKIPVSTGDFNNDGKIDMLSNFVGAGYIQEQYSNSSFNLQTKFSDTTGAFWPALAEDLDGDGKEDVLSFDYSGDTSIVVWRFNNDLSFKDSTNLQNFTPKRYNANFLGFPHAAITDMNKNGRKEIWIADQDGDLFSYESNGSGGYNKFMQDSTFFMSSAEFLTAGDYDGDGTKELAVLLQSIDADIAPFYLLNIYKYNQGSLDLMYQQSFIDPAAEFGGGGVFRKIENSIRFADIDNDGKDELILFVFPYSYIFKYNNNQNEIISYKNNINSNSIFVGDLNQNGIKEVGFQSNNGIKFSEFAVSNKTPTPYNFAGYSTDSNKVYLSWEGEGVQFYIYRGTNKDSTDFLDLSTTNSFIDNSVNNNKNYFYKIQAFDPTKPNELSDLSSPIKIYVHSPAKMISAQSNSIKSVLVKFDQKMNITINNLRAFKVINVGYPKSITAASEYSYLVSFDKGLPVGQNKITLNNLRDLYNSPVIVDTVTFNVDSTLQKDEFYVSNFAIVDPFKIKITFNLDVDENTIKNVSNYTFDPDNKVGSVDIDSKDNKIIYLNLDGNKPVGSIGKIYKLRLQNLKSSVETGNLEINSGAGSYIVLETYAKDLSGVYVYPNPARMGEGISKITFANLPQKAKITIFNLNGKQLYNLEESNGDGGADFNLKDISGNTLNSGVYIFRIVRLDNSGNEVEEKVGKFAVIR